MKQAAKEASREWKEGHGNSRKRESQKQTDINAVVSCVKQRYSWAHSQDFPLRSVGYTYLTWQSMKAVSVYKFIFPVVSVVFPVVSFKFSAETNYIEATAHVNWSASKKFNMFTQKTGEHSHH